MKTIQFILVVAVTIFATDVIIERVYKTYEYIHLSQEKVDRDNKAAFWKYHDQYCK